jgi:tryptophan synthase beta subunit
MRKSQSVIINVSGRGDKDISLVADAKGEGRVPH